MLSDAARRDLEWFAYWVLGKPTQRMLEKYGPPKSPNGYPTHPSDGGENPRQKE
jgi:hypothetical protein